MLSELYIENVAIIRLAYMRDLIFSPEKRAPANLF